MAGVQGDAIPLGGVQRWQSLGRGQGGSACFGVQRVKPFGPVGLMLAAIRIGYCLTHFVHQALAASPLFCKTTLKEGVKSSVHTFRRTRAAYFVLMYVCTDSFELFFIGRVRSRPAGLNAPQAWTFRTLKSLRDNGFPPTLKGGRYNPL